MIIESLKLKNFRNYILLALHPGPGINIFYGDNAQGKTNILEAIYLAGTTKSHRSAKDREMINFKDDEAHIEMGLRKKGLPFCIDMHLKKTSPKGIALNKVPIRKASELFGHVQMVFFSPEDLNIIKDGPALRRRFIDAELSQLDPIYLKDLADYQKVLNQRNRLLKEIPFKPELKDTLPIWDEQLCHYGDRVIKRREDFIRELNAILPDIHRRLTSDEENIHLTYEKNTRHHTMKTCLDLNRERDLRMRSTQGGPQRDDMGFFADDMDIRTYGSQGQQRTAALSLKLSEIELIRKTVHEEPILLLDDVLSELDKKRQNALLDSITSLQTFITCTGLDEFVGYRSKNDKVFYVADGTVTGKN